MRLTKLVREDAGFALVTVMGAMMLITVAATAGFFLAENALNESVRVGAENRAYQAAASALDREFAAFDVLRYQAGQPSLTNYTYGQWEGINGKDEFNVTIRKLGPDEYEMAAVGRSGNSSETCLLRFQSLNLWDMNISGSEQMGAGAGFQGNGYIIGKVFCSGNFDWSGSAGIEGGPLFVTNGQFIKSSTGCYVGSSSQPLVGYFDQEPVVRDGDSRWYVEERGSAPKLQIPWEIAQDLNRWRTAAERDSGRNLLWTTGVGTKHPSAQSDERYNTLNGDSTLGAVNFGKGSPVGVALNPDGSTDESGSADVLAVTPAPFPLTGKVLHINGVTYCTGKITVDSNIKYYAGNGILFAEDGFVIKGRLVPLGYDSPAPNPHAENYTTLDGKSQKLPIATATNCLSLVTPSDVLLDSGQWLVGAVFSAGRFTASGTSALYRGSIISNGISFDLPNGWLVTQPGLKACLPADMPPLDVNSITSDWRRQ